MSILKYILVFVYILLIIANYSAYKNGKRYYLITIVTVILATTLLFSSNMAALDKGDTELDISGYRTLYEQYDVLEHPDFKMYYIFYGLMHLGQSTGMSFYTWWAIMSVLGMVVIAIACKIHGFNYHLFLASFMAYYELVFYSGFKFFYGFCFFLLAYGFLLRDDKYARIKYVLFLLIASGFHSMYYFYLLFVLKPRKRSKRIVGAIAISSVLFTIIIRLSGSAITFLEPFFETLDNEHINMYTGLSVNMGFYLPVFLQMVIVFIAYRIRKYRESSGILNQSTDALFYTSILSLVFCPFYALALTFSRLQTAFSLVLITSNSIYVEDRQGKSLCTLMSILMVMSYWLTVIVSGLKGFIGNSVLPFFDVF